MLWLEDFTLAVLKFCLDSSCIEQAKIAFSWELSVIVEFSSCSSPLVKGSFRWYLGNIHLISCVQVL